MRKEAEHVVSIRFAERTLTLVVIRRRGESKALFGLEKRYGVIEVESRLDHDLLWFSNASRAITAAHEIVLSDPICLSAGIATGDICSVELMGQLIAQARGAANLTQSGQIYVSLGTQELTRSTLSGDKTYVDLGTKELEEGRLCRLFMLCDANYETVSIPTAQAKMWDPILFVGRSNELDDIRHALESNRFVSFSGPSGIGKTSLAARIASETQNDEMTRVIWIDLEEVQRASLLLHKIASELGIAYQQEITLFSQIAKTIGERDVLIIMDGIDFLEEEACSFIEELLQVCLNVSCLTTSVRRVRSQSARCIRVEGLGFPTPFEKVRAMEEYDAVRLFVNVARNVDSTFVLDEATCQDVASILDAVEGSPMAIQMMATRIGILSPRQILARLRDDPLAFLVDKKTKKGAVLTALSTALFTLNPWSRTLFGRLWIFEGAFDLEAVQQVCVDSDFPEEAVLSSLRDLSEAHLIMPSRRSKLRKSFRLSQLGREFSRTFGGENRGKLTPNLNAYLKARERRLWPNGLGSDATTLEEFDLSYEDLRKSWFRLSKSASTAPAVVASLVGCANFWIQNNLYQEGLAVISKIADERSVANSPRFAALLNVGAWLAFKLENFEVARQMVKGGYRIASDARDTILLAKMLNTLTSVYTDLDRPRSALRCASLANEAMDRAGSSPGRAIVKSNLAGVLINAGRLDEAEATLKQVESLHKAGTSWFDVTYLGNYAYFEAESKNWSRCAMYLRRATEVFGSHPNPEGLLSLYLTGCTFCLGQGRFIDLANLLDAIQAMVEKYNLVVSRRRQKLISSFGQGFSGGGSFLVPQWSADRPWGILREIIE